MKSFTAGFLYFLLGVALTNWLVFGFFGRSEDYPQETSANLRGDGVVWKLRDHTTPHELITLSAQHRFAGKSGELQFIVYQGFQEPKYPTYVTSSPVQRVTQPGQWSSWTFHAEHPVLFVGVSWEGVTAPIHLQQSIWKNFSKLHSYAYELKHTQSQIKLQRLTVPIRGNFRVVRDIAYGPESAHWIFFWGILSLTFIWTLLVRRTSPNDIHLVHLVCGIVFSYRYWATIFGPFWAWGAHYLYFVPSLLGLSLLLCFLLFWLLLSFTPKNFGDIRTTEKPFSYTLVVFVLLSLAWGFRCDRVYHDWIYSITNYNHAPLTSSIYLLGEKAVSGVEWLSRNSGALFSLCVFTFFLYFLRLLLRALDRSQATLIIGALFFLSLSTLQLFFGYVGIHSLPMLFWIVFLYFSVLFIDGKTGLYFPSLTVVLAYLCHVSEALLMVPLLFLWGHALYSKKCSLLQLAKTATLLVASAIGITACTHYMIFVLRFESDLAEFSAKFPYYGFELLWGKIKTVGIVLPVFDVSDYSLRYRSPGPRYEIFSFENLIRNINFLFHYSAFCFVLPLLLLIRSNFKDLRDPRISLCAVTLLTYLVYIAVAYIGKMPAMRDWDLFSITSMIGASLLFLLLHKRKEYRIMVLVTVLNLLQTLPWIYVNHQRIPVVW